MLHLLDYAKYTDAVEVPSEVTQGSIAKAAGFDKRHFSQYVRPLLENGLVERRSAHVKGVLQTQRVYGLTYAGWHKAVGLRDRISSAVVSVMDDQGLRKVTIGDALEEARGTKSILDVVRESIDRGHVRLEN